MKKNNKKRAIKIIKELIKWLVAIISILVSIKTLLGDCFPLALKGIINFFNLENNEK